jgi:hypothetical protein
LLFSLSRNFETFAQKVLICQEENIFFSAALYKYKMSNNFSQNNSTHNSKQFYVHNKLTSFWRCYSADIYHRNVPCIIFTAIWNHFVILSGSYSACLTQYWFCRSCCWWCCRCLRRCWCSTSWPSSSGSSERSGQRLF